MFREGSDLNWILMEGTAFNIQLKFSQRVEFFITKNDRCILIEYITPAICSNFIRGEKVKNKNYDPFIFINQLKHVNLTGNNK